MREEAQKGRVSDMNQRLRLFCACIQLPKSSNVATLQEKLINANFTAVTECYNPPKAVTSKMC